MSDNTEFVERHTIIERLQEGVELAQHDMAMDVPNPKDATFAFETDVPRLTPTPVSVPPHILQGLQNVTVDGIVNALDAAKAPAHPLEAYVDSIERRLTLLEQALADAHDFRVDLQDMFSDLHERLNDHFHGKV